MRNSPTDDDIAVYCFLRQHRPEVVGLILGWSVYAVAAAEPGKRRLIVEGPAGCGKTTLVNNLTSACSRVEWLKPNVYGISNASKQPRLLVLDDLQKHSLIRVAEFPHSSIIGLSTCPPECATSSFEVGQLDHTVRLSIVKHRMSAAGAHILHKSSENLSRVTNFISRSVEEGVTAENAEGGLAQALSGMQFVTDAYESTTRPETLVVDELQQIVKSLTTLSRWGTPPKSLMC